MDYAYKKMPDGTIFHFQVIVGMPMDDLISPGIVSATVRILAARHIFGNG